MAHKTFISYKYADVVENKGRDNLRDKIIRKLGDDAKYYFGENSASPYLGDLKTETIKQKLSNMIYGTSVIIVILSPHVKQSEWMEWEIKYALRTQTRQDRKSYPNGIVAVVKKQDNVCCGYSWMKKFNGDWDESCLFSVLKNNRNNRISYSSNLSQNYVDIVTEDEFLRDPNKHIEDAFIKSQNIEFYDLAK